MEGSRRSLAEQMSSTCTPNCASCSSGMSACTQPHQLSWIRAPPRHEQLHSTPPYQVHPESYLSMCSSTSSTWLHPECPLTTSSSNQLNLATSTMLYHHEQLPGKGCTQLGPAHTHTHAVFVDTSPAETVHLHSSQPGAHDANLKPGTIHD